MLKQPVNVYVALLDDGLYYFGLLTMFPLSNSVLSSASFFCCSFRIDDGIDPNPFFNPLFVANRKP